MTRLKELSPAKQMLVFVVFPFLQTLGLVFFINSRPPYALNTGNVALRAGLAVVLFLFFLGADAMFIALWGFVRSSCESAKKRDGHTPPLQLK
jgi:VanZ family protein